MVNLLRGGIKMITASTTYPMELTIDYPDRKLNKLTTFFRPFMVIPIAIILGLIIGADFTWERDGQSFQAATGGLVILPTVLMKSTVDPFVKTIIFQI